MAGHPYQQDPGGGGNPFQGTVLEQLWRQYLDSLPGSFGAGGGGGSSSGSPNTFSGANPDYYAPPQSLAATGPSSAASGAPPWLRPLMGVGIPAAVTALTNRGAGGSPGGAGANGLTPDLQQQLMDLIDMQKRRLGRQEPVHEAAMRLAMNFSNRPSGNPRIQSTTDPQVLAAIQRLTSGVG